MRDMYEEVQFERDKFNESKTEDGPGTDYVLTIAL